MNKNRKKRIGQILLEQKIINQKQLEQSLSKQHISHDKIGQILIDLGYISKTQLKETLAIQKISNTKLKTRS